MVRPTTEAAARLKAAALELEHESAPLGRPEVVGEAVLPVLVLLVEALVREAEAPELVGATLAEDRVVVPAAGVPVDENAVVELVPPTVDPLTIENGALSEVVLLWVI